MTFVAKGAVSRLFIDIEEDEGQKHIGKIVFCLNDAEWVEFSGVTLEGEKGFCLPEPMGCECFVTDISDRQWGNANFEIEFASSYSRYGVFWARTFQRLTDFSVQRSV